MGVKHQREKYWWPLFCKGWSSVVPEWRYKRICLVSRALEEKHWARKLIMQDDGNLVMLDKDGNILWESGSTGKCPIGMKMSENTLQLKYSLNWTDMTFSAWKRRLRYFQFRLSVHWVPFKCQWESNICATITGYSLFFNDSVFYFQ